MKEFKDIGVAIGVIFFVGISATFLLPIFPIDETRSLSVAWEMWRQKSLLVPLLNGEWYAHKPPFLFWIIHLSWWIFGVNEITPRLIPMLFGMGGIWLVYRIALLLWPGERKTAMFAALLLSSTLIYLIWSVLILYEVILTFWVLLTVFGALHAYRQGGIKGWGAVSAGIAGGILTKGPVVFVHVVPVLVAIGWWGGSDGKGYAAWLGRLSGALLTGVFLACLWVVPAVIRGGEAYRHAILWGQTAKRVVDSFAHRRAIWWYLPLLPLLFLPWTLIKSAWGWLLARGKTWTEGDKACLTWFLASLTIFSVVSGKQVYYLIPSLPPALLLFARGIAREEGMHRSGCIRPWGIALALVILGGVACFLPLVHISSNTGKLSWAVVVPLATILVGAGFFLMFRQFRSAREMLKAVSVLVSVVLVSALAVGSRTIFRQYDLRPLARQVKARMDEGRCITFIGAYHGELQFLGRLSRPIIELKGNRFLTYLKEHPDCLVIDTVKYKSALRLKKIPFCYIQPYREERVIFLIRGRDYLDNFAGQ